jgi:DNA segregation ATPase FtsK/SpoIIIE and related proteins
MDIATIYDIVFHWVLPFSLAVGVFFALIKRTDALYRSLNLDRIWVMFVKIGLGLSALVLVWYILNSTGIIANVQKYANQALVIAQDTSFIMQIWQKFLYYLANVVTFISFWTPIYIRAFVVIGVIGTYIQIQALIWRVDFLYAVNIILPTWVMFPFLSLRYMQGYTTPIFDFKEQRLLRYKVKENANDGWKYARQGKDDKGNKFENGVGGSVQTAKIQNADLSIYQTNTKVVTKYDNTSGQVMRTAIITVRNTRETETDKMLETSLQGFGQRVVAPSIRFQDNPTLNVERGGYTFDSRVPYNAGDNLGTWKTIFVNPFEIHAEDFDEYEQVHRKPFRYFVNVVVEMFRYISALTPPAIADRIQRRADRLYSIDTSLKKAKVKAQQNLDLDVVPIPDGIAETRKKALKVAHARVGDVTNALNANKIRGTFSEVVVGGNTAVYRYALPASADLPTDFGKVQESVSNILKVNDIPTIRVAAGMLELTMVNGVSIPVDFRNMIETRKQGMPGIISGMAGVDALGNNIYIELGDKNPHGMLFGKTGTGKTVTIMTILYSIMDAVDPSMLRIAYVDGKGNSFEFMRTDSEGKTPNPFTYAQPADASGDIEYARALIKHMEKVTRDRIELFKNANVTKLADYNKKFPDKKLPEILFVVDEFSAITQQDKNLKASELAEKGTVDTFEYIAKMSRSVGIRMLLANQSARKELVPGKISANVTGRVSLGVAEPIESEIALPDAKIAVHLVSQPGEFYSIFNGVRNPEHGNSPYLPDEVMQALNASLEKKFGHIDYMVTRDEVMGGSGDDGEAKMPSPEPTIDSSVRELVKVINEYPAWAVANKNNPVITQNREIEKLRADTKRKRMLEMREKQLREALAEAESKAPAVPASTDTRKASGSRVVDIARGNDAGIL